MSKNLIIASTSTIYGSGYLEYLLPTLAKHFAECSEIIFIPYARPGGISHDAYTDVALKAFEKIGKRIVGLHTFKDPVSAILDAAGIFTGGGNTFVLVNMLYKTEVMPALRTILHQGTPYLGTSAGSNICGLTMQTTNDMPIAYPPSFKTLGMAPFNINPHYIDPIKGDTHMGETRETRIKEFHAHNDIPVVGLREGSWIQVANKKMVLHGEHTARIFTKGKDPFEIETGSLLSF
ncbi:dipeptidase PepE [Dokdonia sinensis]|uniref:Dipeptidase PepE n=1 Tax=Dokdonia sinensis TaxID=2479847 RepID=A0A3M0FUN9_9FLAO|nr:dipeptidase PepE [Dokdonia sinensis]RMB56371.1 dipeptidase PepE [Dokdonia sinensis]